MSHLKAAGEIFPRAIGGKNRASPFIGGAGGRGGTGVGSCTEGGGGGAGGH